ncbi:MAG: hypothetical protein ABIH37_05265 [archaeon]
MTTLPTKSKSKYELGIEKCLQTRNGTRIKLDYAVYMPPEKYMGFEAVIQKRQSREKFTESELIQLGDRFSSDYDGGEGVVFSIYTDPETKKRVSRVSNPIKQDDLQLRTEPTK